MTIRLLLISGIIAVSILPGVASRQAVAADNPPVSTMPRIVEKDGRFALFVDGAPYLMLGVQINNSSAWPSMLPKVWPAVEYVHANTVEMPVYWEQMEPEPGQFDYSVVDTLIAQARRHNVHLVLLWFGTWKNGSGHYWPLWMKLNPARYTRVISSSGRLMDSPSPLCAASLQADVTAFTALMRHLKVVDPVHTVLMVQVENETGTWGSERDYSPAANALFAGPVPSELLHALNVPVSRSPPTWTEQFGSEAEVDFHAWCIARYVGQVAAAGKSVYSLPLYVNASLRDPIPPAQPGTYESGGPTDNVIQIWKAAAPAIDVVSPDIYMNDSTKYLRVLDLYNRPDNPLFVPETGSASTTAPMFFAALGRGAIGWSPFGIDFTSTRHAVDDPQAVSAWLDPLRMNYEAVAPMDRQIASLEFEGNLQAAVESTGTTLQTLNFGGWNAVVSYGAGGFGAGAPRGNPTPIGRALIAKVGPDQFLVTGLYCRVDFAPSDPNSSLQRQYLRVDEGSYMDGAFKPIRIWNGDQTDLGLNLGSVPVVLRIRLGVY